MAHDVFISYSHRDKAVAHAICAKLEAAGMRCWYAPRNIAPGETWAGAIPKAIEEARIFVIVFTDRYNSSPQVVREVNLAVSSGLTIIPFRLTRSEPEGDMGYYLGAVHWLDAVDESQKKAIEKLARRCRAVLNGEPLPEEEPGTGKAGKPGRGWLFAGLGIAVAALAALALILIPRLNPPAEPTAETAAPAEAPAEEITPLFGNEISNFPDLNAKYGDVVTFGHYWLNNDREKDGESAPEPLTWRVMEKGGDSLLLMSDQIIDTHVYSDVEEDVTWETSAIRKWLNSEFLASAFTPAELACLEVSEVKAEASSGFPETPQGSDTKDRAWLMSVKEASRYQLDEQKRQPKATARVKKLFGISWLSDNYKTFFWLRTMGRSNREATYVAAPNPHIMSDGDSAYFYEFGVVPMIRVNKYSVITASGMVGKDGQEQGK